MFKLKRDHIIYSAILALVLTLGILSKIVDGSFLKKAATSINNNDDPDQINGTFLGDSVLITDSIGKVNYK